MMRESGTQPASGHRIIDITTKAACAVTLKIDWTCTRWLIRQPLVTRARGYMHLSTIATRANVNRKYFAFLSRAPRRAE